MSPSIANRPYLICLIGVFLLASGLRAEEIKLTDNTRSVGVGLASEIFEDRKGQVTVADVAQGHADAAFLPNKTEVPSLGITGSAIWLRVRIVNTSNQSSWYLEHSYPPVSDINVYVLREHGMEDMVGGSSYPFDSRALRQKNYVFRIQIQKGEHVTLLMRFRTDNPMELPLTLWKPEAFLENVILESYALGLYFGIIFLMAAYNFVLFATIKESSYLYYTLYLLFLGGTFASLTGIGSELLWGQFPKFATTLPIAFGCPAVAFALQFARTFLNLRKNARWIDLVLKALIVWYVFILTLLFILPYGFVQKAMLPTHGLALMLIFATAVRVTLKGYRPARFFLLAFSMFLLGAFANISLALGAIEHSFLAKNGVLIGSVIEVILLSLALADRWNTMKQEKEQAQKDTIEHQRDALNTETQMSTAFARFVPKDFLTILGRVDIRHVTLGDAVEKEMTVLFTDIRSFTTISETMTPQENFRFLNSMLGQAGPLIRNHRGFIDKYIGDAIMALFEGDPEDALSAAIAIRKGLHQFNALRKEKGLEPIQIGIGINTGNLMLGTIGEPERMEGTVISDAVNVASRMEGLTKFYDTTILISDRTFLKIANASKYNFRVLDTVRVKGKKESISVIEVLDGDGEESLALKVATKPEFERGIRSYMNREFAEAIACFKAVLNRNARDRAAQLYCDRADYYAQHGVPPGWDAVENFAEK